MNLLHILLVFVPLAIAAELLGWSPGAVFILSALGMIPLADLIGEATEEIAARTGPRVGGLLNATLGNAAELIIAIFALKEGLVELVKASITGSILGNLLLVLGASLLLGGIKNGIQTFDRRQSGMNTAMLLLAVVGLSIPSFFISAAIPDEVADRIFSEGVAIVMIVLYGLSVLYSFVSPKSPLTRPAALHEARWGLWRSLGTLVGAVAVIALLSEFLVGQVTHVTEQLGLSEFFLGIIVIPLVGNVAEHLVGVQVAIKNKMDLSLEISLGSSLQVALFVAPILVFISLLMGQPLFLVFNPYELVALIAASIIAAFVALDGESNWLEGAMLLAVYLIIGLAFFFLPGGA
jgi:Ca2+:H+ antiporter